MSTTTAIGVEMPEFSGVMTGGSDILSYSLEYEQSIGNWVVLVGFTPYTTN